MFIYTSITAREMYWPISADNATVTDLIGLTFWKYIEERRGPPVFVRDVITVSALRVTPLIRDVWN